MNEYLFYFMLNRLSIVIRKVITMIVIIAMFSDESVEMKMYFVSLRERFVKALEAEKDAGGPFQLFLQKSVFSLFTRFRKNTI